MITKDEMEIPSYKGKDVYWYIIGGLHNIESFYKLALSEPVGLLQWIKFL
jgi:hypothetical protein